MRRLPGIKDPSNIIYRIDSKRTAAGEEGWPLIFSMNTFPFKGDVASSDTGGDFPHAGSMNCLYGDFHVDGKKFQDIFGSYLDHICK
jgi:prepilin-type processing-associated H-X9-DG protein